MAENYSGHEQKIGRWWKKHREGVGITGAIIVLGSFVGGAIYTQNNQENEKKTVTAIAHPTIDRAQREQALKDQLTVDGFPAIDKISFGEPHTARASTQVSVDIGIGACILRDVSATAEIDEAGGVRDVHNYRFSFTTEPAVAYPFENADDLPGVFHDQDPCKAVLDHTPVAVLR